MRTVLMIGLLVTALGPAALAQNADVKWPDCYCTDKTGARIELGEVICLRVDGRDFQARCEMSLNNPMWRETGQGCLSSRNTLPQRSDPLRHASLVHP